MAKRRIKLTAGDVSFNTITYTLFALFTLLCVFPFYYIFINTISANDLSSRGLITFYPMKVHLNNYAEVFRIRGIGAAAWISLLRTVIGTATNVLCTTFVGYILSKKILWKQKLWNRFFIITLYFNVGLIPWFLNMKNLGLTNTFMAYVIAVINPYNLVLVKTYVESISPSMEESAEMDGASTMRVFFSIIFPLCKPIVATIAVFTAVMQWNQFIDTLILMTNNTRLYTLQFLLWQYLNEAKSLVTLLQGSGGAMHIDPSRFLTSTSIKMTISMVVVFPILFIYPFFQRYFVKGIMLGAVKG